MHLVEYRTKSVQYAVFFAGWPPFAATAGKVKVLLADECEDTIDVPTCHVVGCKDPYIGGSMALYGLCDSDTATIFDHGNGHAVPRDGQTVEELAEVVQQTITKAVSIG
jgi:hypothetical protein